uniref:DUF38 domain-containing protein n=1 Tax=Panagrolaimus sp. ES5 TaxID=591445 RepID=A0AC34FQW3_9BILA
MFESSFKDSLDPSYLQAITKLEDDLKDVEDNGKKLDLLVQFSSTYMMPKELWNEYFELTHEFQSPIEERERTKAMILPSVYHFYYKSPIAARDYFGPLRLPKRKLLKWKSTAISAFDIGAGVSPNAATLIKDISFPNENIERKWRQYEKSSSSMPPQKVVRIYQKMKALFAKIEEVEKSGDEEEWIKALMEVGDNAFVEHNIEYRLGGNLANKKLWKLCIQYLRGQQQDVHKLLQTYSKYCRFFLDDTDMKEEYLQAATDYGNPVEVPWKNPFEFEIQTENALSNYFSKNYDPSNTDDDEEEVNSKSTVYFNTNNLNKHQNFPFKTPVIHYIIQNANARVLQNLFKSCKWFFVKYPIPICYSLVTKQRPMGKPEINFYQQSVEVVKSALNKTGLENIYLSTTLQIITPRDRMLLSDFIPKMFRCDAKYISIANQDLTFKELKFLIGHGNVVDLYLLEVKTIDEQNKEIAVEDVLKLVPKVQFINIGGIPDTPKTAQILSQLKFENKIESFNLNIENLEPHDFVEFIKKNMAPKSRIFIHYKFKNNAEVISNFRQIVGNAINLHWNENDRPMFKAI